MKKKFISGLMKKKNSEAYNGWMNNTGFNEFTKSLSNIVQNDNYFKIIFYHINKSLILLSNKKITYFDELYNSLYIINSRIEKLKSLKKNLEIPKYIMDNLNIINKKINDYLINGINTYSGSTIELTVYFLNKIEEYNNIIKNLFKTNPLEESKNMLNYNRLTLLENDFDKYFNIDVFIELYNKNKITDLRFKNSIFKTLSLDLMLFTELIIHINNNKHILNKSIQKYNDIIIDTYIQVRELRNNNK